MGVIGPDRKLSEFITHGLDRQGRCTVVAAVPRGTRVDWAVPLGPSG